MLLFAYSLTVTWLIVNLWYLIRRQAGFNSRAIPAVMLCVDVLYIFVFLTILIPLTAEGG